ncbi:MAG: 30S ribosomal protein S17 [Candidatus Omnitrophica bacterium]|nr:30S ribosomal protein S17 [Candidatus Omnitrophota bacterium]
MQNNAEKAKVRRMFDGTVTSDKMDKTIVVSVMSFSRHPKYKKTMKRYVKFKVHDEGNEAKEGDRVRIVETRPLSRDKRWRLVEILEKNIQ